MALSVLALIHLSVGVCSQNEKLREKFTGTPEKVVNLFTFIAEETKEILNLKVINAQSIFLRKLKGITDPESKRKIIGETFIRVFEKESNF